MNNLFKNLSRPTPVVSRCFDMTSLLRRLILSWLLTTAYFYQQVPEKLRDLSKLDGIATLSFGKTVVVTLILTVIFSAVALFFRTEHFERIAMTVVFALFSCMVLKDSYTIYFFLFCMVVLVILIVDTAMHLQPHMKGIQNQDDRCVSIEDTAEKRSLFAETPFLKRVAVCLAILFGAMFLTGVITMTVCRVLGHSSPTFDFGIFSQMYYYMKETGLPFTTVEREVGLLSHFDVHVSPIYYLLLPLYALFPSPITLQVGQALVLASSLIPLYLLARKKGISPMCTALLCGALAFYPALAGGTYYDLHENKFLTPCLLFLFYFTETRKPIGMGICTLLVLSVKEDAPVYVAIYALYLLVRTLISFRESSRRDKVFGFISGGVMMVCALGWFFFVTWYLSTVGDGVMTYRYSNFMYDGSDSLISVIKCVLIMPFKALYEIADADKFTFFLQTMLPLLFIPFMTRRHERLLLVVPYLLINLMSDYRYQHDIFFQYTYGSTAFLFYLLVLNLADMKREVRRTIAVAPVVVGFMLSVPTVGQKVEYYYNNYVDNRATHEAIDDILSKIPEDASVTTTTWYTVPLSQRKILYDLYYGSEENIFSTDYVVINPADSYIAKRFATDNPKTNKNGLARLKQRLAKEGYVLVDSYEKKVLVYQKQELIESTPNQ